MKQQRGSVWRVASGDGHVDGGPEVFNFGGTKAIAAGMALQFGGHKPQRVRRCIWTAGRASRAMHRLEMQILLLHPPASTLSLPSLLCLNIDNPFAWSHWSSFYITFRVTLSGH